MGHITKRYTEKDTTYELSIVVFWGYSLLVRNNKIIGYQP